MDSLSSFYDLFEDGADAKVHPESAPGPRAPGPEISEDGLPGLGDLDSSVELSLDLQELIDRASKTEDHHQLTDDPLNQDLLFPEIAACPEIQGIISREHELEAAAAPAEVEPMTHIVEVQVATNDSESSVVTLRAEGSSGTWYQLT